MAVKIQAFRLSGRVEIDAKSAHKDLKTVETEAKLAEKSFRGLKGSIGGIGGSLKGIMGGGGDSGGGLLGGLASGLQLLPGLSVVAGALGSVTSAMQSGLKIGFDYNRMIEENQIGFEKFLGSTQAARAHISELSKLSKVGIALPEALEGSKRLQAMGFSAKEVLSTLTTIGDAARGSGADVDSVTRALVQMRAKGVVSAEEVTQQLAEQGIPAWKYLGDAVADVDKKFAKLGSDERIAQVQKLVAAGKISGKGGVEAILRGMDRDYAGSGARFAKETASGQELQLKDTAARTLGAGSGNLLDAYKDMLQKLNERAASPQTMEAALKVNQAMGAGITSVEDFTKSLSNYQSAIDEASRDLTERAQKFQEGSLTDKAKIVGGAYMDYTPGGMLLKGGKNLMQGKNFLAPSAKFSPQNQFVQSPKSDNQKLIEENAKRTAIMPEILEAMMHQESRGKSNAVSNMGARGLMQLMPATAARFGVTNSFDPAQNITGGATYMRWLLNRFKGNTQLALAGYNTGEGNVDKAIKRAGGSHRFEDIKPFLAKETQGYVTSIMADLKNRLANSGRGGSNGLAINDDYEVETGFTYSGGPARRKLRYGNTPVEHMSTISQDDYERNSERDPFMRAGSVLDVRVTNPESFVDRYDLETGEAMPFKNRYDVMPKGITDAAQNLSFLNDIPHDLPAVFSTFNTEFKSMAGEFGTFGLGFPPLIDGMQSLDTAVEKTEASLAKAPLTFKELMVATEKVKLSFAQTLRGSLDQASGFLPSQQVGKKRGFFSKLLGGAAPFLQFIPGFGPIASQLASIAGSAVGGDYGGALSGASKLKFGGKRAFGGRVSKGRAYIVGDGGREEVFSPDQDGMIHPNANNFRRGGASSGGNSAYEHTMLAVLHTLQAHTERVGHHLARIEATSPGDVFVAGAKARPHAATDAVTRSLAMDASRIDVMGRRLNLA